MRNSQLQYLEGKVLKWLDQYLNQKMNDNTNNIPLLIILTDLFNENTIIKYKN
jgi:hypothetical protein